MIAVGLIVVAAGLQQDSIRITNTPKCQTCIIELEHVITLGSEADSTSPDERFAMARTSEGATLVAPLMGRASVGVYGRNGRLRREIGRSGEGPGEFRWASQVAVGPGDSLLVFDALLARFTVYAEDYSLAGVFRVDDPFVQGFVPFGARDLVAFAKSSEPSGTVLHHVMNGRTVRSFAHTEDWRDASFPLRVGRSSNGRFWVVPRNKYEVELWDTAGTMLRRYRAERDWFEEWFTSVPFTREPPHTQVDAVWEDSDGLLWLLFSTAAADWSAANADRERSAFNVWADKFYDSRVEVIDPQTGELIATRSFSNMFIAVAMTTPGLVEFEQETESGWVALRVGVLALKRPGEGEAVPVVH